MELKTICSLTEKFEKRDCFSKIQDFLTSTPENKILLIYGLRRTGKTTLMRQSILSLPQEEFSHTVYMKVNDHTSLTNLSEDLKKLWNIGVRNVFIDEVTLIEDFIDGSSLLSDIFAPTGMRIVCSGTDSLGFLIASKEELYDRCILIHTTHIPLENTLVY